MSKNQELTITSAGLDVMSGKRNWLEITNHDRWISGVHIEPSNIWCWYSDFGSKPLRTILGIYNILRNAFNGRVLTFLNYIGLNYC